MNKRRKLAAVCQRSEAESPEKRVPAAFHPASRGKIKTAVTPWGLPLAGFLTLGSVFSCKSSHTPVEYSGQIS
jgi:hypothetical protein